MSLTELTKVIDGAPQLAGSRTKPLQQIEETEDEEDEGVELYKGTFSLAYGTLTPS